MLIADATGQPSISCMLTKSTLPFALVNTTPSAPAAAAAAVVAALVTVDDNNDADDDVFDTKVVEISSCILLSFADSFSKSLKQLVLTI